MIEPTCLSSWTHALRKQLDALGLDSAALCRQAGLDPQETDDPNTRCPLSASTRLWQLAVEASGDPAIGLRVSRFVSPTTFHGLGYALVASGSLREVFERIARYHQAVSDSLHLELTREQGRYLFRLHAPGGIQPAPEAIDAFAAIYVRTCRSRLGRDYAPLAVVLTRPTPADPAPWHTVFRTEVQFDAEENRLEFACADFDCHLDDASPDLLQPLTWERRVRQTIEAQLPEGVPSDDQVAQALHLSPRGLQRHLADEGCRYDSLLDECRQNLALRYLRDPNCSLNEVSCLLGFANTCSFNRVFKRWTGMSPQEYRDRWA